MSQRRWLRVTVKDGLFPSERTVLFRTSDGEEVSVFITVGQIDEQRQRISVTLLDEDENHALVQIPSQGGISTVRIPRDMTTPDP